MEEGVEMFTRVGSRPLDLLLRTAFSFSCQYIASTCGRNIITFVPSMRLFQECGIGRVLTIFPIP